MSRVIVNTLDEAIKLAIAESAPGEIVIVHSEACDTWRVPAGSTERQFEESCTCEPLHLVVGATA